MNIERKYKKDKELVFEIESHAKDIRSQLSEQMRCLDVRQDAHIGMLWELQDFFRRRAEVEAEYARQLDKLVKNIQSRHRQEKLRREQWPFYSTHNCWQSLLVSTRRQSRDHATLSDIYTTQMTSRFQDIMDDMQRIHKKCRDIGAENHDELIKVLNELQSAMKTYHQYHGESIQAENKLRYVESQKLKAEQGSKSGTLSKKARSMEKQADKKQKKYMDSKQKALVARNEYLLSLDTANAAIQRYYCDDLHNLINCIDCGYHNSVARALMMHASADENLVKSRQQSVRNLNACIEDLDQRADKQRFLEIFNQAFVLPKKFEFQPHKGDEVRQISAQKVVQADLLERLHTLDQNIKKNKLETDEMWKTIESVEGTYVELINQKDYDVTQLFNEEQRPPKSPHEKYKKRSDRMDTEEFYITKFRDFTIQSNRIARLQAKFNSLQKALGEGGDSGSLPRPPSLPPKPKNSRRLGKIPKEGTPKLFGGSIEEYVEATGQEIPMVVRSCVRVINLYGRYHQGVFRVSGSQHEINEFKNTFEKGEDPLQDIISAKDINSVAGLLKLYFRELKEPLFPTHLFDELINCSKLGKPHESMMRVRELISDLPRPIFVVARYLFAFLSHLSEYSDENMMDAYNLAICFGPTVLPIPPDRDQVQFQNYVIDLVKNIILQHEMIFPKEIEGAVYEKIVIEEEDGDAQDNIDNLSDEDIDEIADTVSEEDIFIEPDILEAIAQYDFQGRTQRELSFKKGDVLEVYEQVSPDWWRGCMRGTKGLIPAKYIFVRSLREREEERLNKSSTELSARDKRKSAESLPARSCGLATDMSASQPNVSLPLTSQSVLGLSVAGSGASKPQQQQLQQQSPTQERSVPVSENLSVSLSLSRDGSGFSRELGVDSPDRSRERSRERSQTPAAPSPIHSGQTSPAIRSDVSLGLQNDVITAAEVDYSPNFKEVISLKDATLASSYTESVVEGLLSDITQLPNRNLDTSSLSQETLLSKDSGFSQTSSSRENTPSVDGSRLKGSSSQELLEQDYTEEEEEATVVEDAPPITSKTGTGDSSQTGSERPTPDWHHDIDDALAEIMHGVESLEKQQQMDQTTSDQVLGASDTPDLVIGLPVGQTTPSPAASPKTKSVEAAVLSTAEVFANSNQSTIKKGMIIPKGHALESSASAGSVPKAFQSQPSTDEEAIMRRTASTTAAMRSRHKKKPKHRERHLSDPQADDSGSTPETPISVFQQRTVHIVKPPPQRGDTPERKDSAEKPFPAQQQQATTHEQLTTPRGPKPPIKIKPPVMKKPVFTSPEMLKRRKEAKENLSTGTPPS